MQDRATSWAKFGTLQRPTSGDPDIAMKLDLETQTLRVRLCQGQTRNPAAFRPSSMSETRARRYSLIGFDKLSPNGNGQQFIKGQFTPEPS